MYVGEAKHLFVRLWMRRKRRWVRLDKLKANNKHVRDFDVAGRQLREHGLLATHEIPVDDALELLSVEELKLIAPCRATNRAGYLAAIKTQYNAAEIRRRVGSCILLDEHVHALFHRVHLIYYRLTVLEQDNPMVAAILARISRRNYPEYVTCRTTNVWPSRDDFLAYEQALQIERQFEEQSLTCSTASRVVVGDMLACWELCENCIGVWEDMLKTRDETRCYALRQFEACRVYTRLLDHGTHVLAKLHEYELEGIMLRKLLDQKVYRLAKRGYWYDRLALVQMKNVDRKAKKQALATCIEGVQDPTVHSIDLHRLHRRIHRLERDLAIPKREQLDFSYLKLRKPEERIIYGERISDAVTGFKSVWRADDGAECSVEALALDYYKKQGYTQGHHTENGMLSMLFMLLFWDIVFAPRDGVFETPYQTAPLDMGSDSFYAGRVGMINGRIADIEQGKFLELITRVDERERPRQTVCVGVHWDYTLEELLQLAECMGAMALSSLCRLLAEEFGQRRGGMPDLCCWDYEGKKCLFVEVKGPGDKLSETQKAWIDTLAGFNLAVEVCYVKIWKGEDVLL
ncbi:VRR-NUC domain-containing protein [Zychaea mexicana]|uniref:VRR-NUC domain-containing protein n=1 Tax=Zychaea mexicana TaxID=64656 RepID=UPI0022FEE00E|nr:VRR-NUC domain-containing protein [Zychaea mexicana]KAI9494936.1 VRR-NUC domain-containing protein [Zychaea mexicana]